jgi:hypothetical protein
MKLIERLGDKMVEITDLSVQAVQEHEDGGSFRECIRNLQCESPWEAKFRPFLNDLFVEVGGNTPAKISAGSSDDGKLLQAYKAMIDATNGSGTIRVVTIACMRCITGLKALTEGSGG